MKNTDAFSGLHPAVGFTYFGLVLAFSMTFMHPVCLGVSLVSALVCAAHLRGRRAARASLRRFLPFALLAAAANPAFSHEGATILAYLPSGNPLTLESIAYGLAAAAMLLAVIVWFSCLSETMTSDKFVYLFGRAAPALSLTLSMTLRFVPRFSAQLGRVREARRGAGADAEGGLPRRVKGGLAVLSAMVTWSLENALETADSMRSRGYGLPGRTAFSIYRFGSRDRETLVWLLACGAYLAAGALAGGLSFRYYPSLSAAPLTAFTASFPAAYLALCLTPVLTDLPDGLARNGKGAAA